MLLIIWGQGVQDLLKCAFLLPVGFVQVTIWHDSISLSATQATGANQSYSAYRKLTGV